MGAARALGLRAEVAAPSGLAAQFAVDAGAISRAEALAEGADAAVGGAVGAVVR